jgi:hypothetical protein
MDIANNYITTQDNEKLMNSVDCGGLDQSRHARQLMPGGTLTYDCETTPMKKLFEKLMEEPATKPATKPERNEVILATPRMIDPKPGLWSKVAQGGNFNKSEFKEVSPTGKPIK